MRMLRRLRGLLGLALSWSVVWIVVGLGIYLVDGVVNGRAIYWDRIPTFALRLGLVGALCGSVFALLVAVLERRQTFGGLTFRRMALWGALGGCVFPAVILSTQDITMGGTEVAVFGLFGGLGVLSSLGILALARRAPVLAHGGERGALDAGAERGGGALDHQVAG